MTRPCIPARINWWMIHGKLQGQVGRSGRFLPLVRSSRHAQTPVGAWCPASPWLFATCVVSPRVGSASTHLGSVDFAPCSSAYWASFAVWRLSPHVWNEAFTDGSCGQWVSVSAFVSLCCLVVAPKFTATWKPGGATVLAAFLPGLCQTAYRAEPYICSRICLELGCHFSSSHQDLDRLLWGNYEVSFACLGPEEAQCQPQHSMLTFGPGFSSQWKLIRFGAWPCSDSQGTRTSHPA